MEKIKLSYNSCFADMKRGKTLNLMKKRAAMENKVIRHIHRYAKPMYVMVSIPEANIENIYKSPIVLGCFKSKEDARAAWKARTSEYKSIKAKTVHVYYFNLQTDTPEIPETVFFCGTYRVTEYSGKLKFVFLPQDSYPDIESYNNVMKWVENLRPLSIRECCERSEGWQVFYASNESFCMKCPVNKLVMISVLLTQRNSNKNEIDRGIT